MAAINADSKDANSTSPFSIVDLKKLTHTITHQYSKAKILVLELPSVSEFNTDINDEHINDICNMLDNMVCLHKLHLNMFQ